MAQTELKILKTKIGEIGNNRCGCGATVITGTDLFVGDWIAVQVLAASYDPVLDYAHASGATVVDWEWSGDLTLSTKASGQIYYGNFSQIRLASGSDLLAYKRCK